MYMYDLYICSDCVGNASVRQLAFTGGRRLLETQHSLEHGYQNHRHLLETWSLLEVLRYGMTGV